MKHPVPATSRTAAAFTILAPTLLFALPGAALADREEATESSFGDVEVTNTETVQVYTDASGQVQEQRVYEQPALTGDGDVTIANPVSTMVCATSTASAVSTPRETTRSSRPWSTARSGCGASAPTTRSCR